MCGKSIIVVRGEAKKEEAFGEKVKKKKVFSSSRHCRCPESLEVGPEEESLLFCAAN